MAAERRTVKELTGMLEKLTKGHAEEVIAEYVEFKKSMEEKEAEIINGK